MSINSKAAEVHVKAATHHETAALHHKEAAKAYQAGKPELAAHHALVAHGHLAHATDLATAAAKEHAASSGTAAKAV
jgi:hypothetical protein